MKKTAMFVFAAALCSVSLFGQKPKSTEWTGAASPIQLEPADPDGLTKIFSNLGPPTSAYSAGGWYVAGPASELGNSQFIGMPFKPKQAATVSEVKAALQYDGAGANEAQLSLYSDIGGAPGVSLAGPVTVRNLPTFYTCCKLATAKFSTPVGVTAGVQYWVVATTPASGRGDDLLGVWAFVPPSKTFVGSDVDGDGWYSFAAPIEVPAGAVYGTLVP
jgi:hypothetical protein